MKQPERNETETREAVGCRAWLGRWFHANLLANSIVQFLLQVFRTLQIKIVVRSHNENFRLLLRAKNLLHCVGVKLRDFVAWVLIHTGDRYRCVWTSDGRIWIGGVEVHRPNDPSSASARPTGCESKGEVLERFAAASG